MTLDSRKEFSAYDPAKELIVVFLSRGNALVITEKEETVDENVPIWLELMECRDGAESFLNCSENHWLRESCFDHSEDIYLKCNAGK
jgi:hypothetical protein